MTHETGTVMNGFTLRSTYIKQTCREMYKNSLNIASKILIASYYLIITRVIGIKASK